MLDKILDFIRSEPVAVASVLVALLQAIFGVLVAFNLPITIDQQNSLITLVGALIGATALAAVIVRGKVSPVYSLEKRENEKIIEDAIV